MLAVERGIMAVQQGVLYQPLRSSQHSLGWPAINLITTNTGLRKGKIFTGTEFLAGTHFDTVGLCIDYRISSLKIIKML